MATLRNQNHKNPWHARAKRDDLEFSLGYYPTKEEAEAAERKFAVEVPPYPRGRRKCHTALKETE